MAGAAGTDDDFEQAVHRVDSRLIAANVPGPSCAASTRSACALFAHELESDQEALVQALKDGIRLPDRKAAAQAAMRDVQLVYGSQLQRPEDELAVGDRLDVGSMTREERNRLKRRLLAQHPELVDEYRGLASNDP
jgi:hypothetical protein